MTRCVQNPMLLDPPALYNKSIPTKVHSGAQNDSGTN